MPTPNTLRTTDDAPNSRGGGAFRTLLKYEITTPYDYLTNKYHQYRVELFREYSENLELSVITLSLSPFWECGDRGVPVLMLHSDAVTFDRLAGSHPQAEK